MQGGIEKHLAGLGAEGEFVGTSEFTLNTLKAAQKLSKYQLPSPSLWAVKLVQAAVAYGAPSCEVEFHGRRLRIRFQAAMSQSKARGLLSDVLGGRISQNGGDFHLTAGIRASVDGPTQRWCWRVYGTDGYFGVECDENGVHPVDEESEPEGHWIIFDTYRPYRFPGFRELFKAPVKHLACQTYGELLVLSSHCWVCPIPLVVDGRRVNGPFLPALGLPGNFNSKTSGHVNYASFSLGRSRYNLLHKSLPITRHGLALPYPWTRQPGRLTRENRGESQVSRQRLTFRDETWLDWPLHPKGESGGHLFLQLGTPLQPTIDWVCDGAVVDSTLLPWHQMSQKQMSHLFSGGDAHLSLRVALPVQQQELDLSHFGVRNSMQLMRDSLPSLARHTADSLLELQRQVKHMRVYHQTRPKLKLLTHFYFIGAMRGRVKEQAERFKMGL